MQGENQTFCPILRDFVDLYSKHEPKHHQSLVAHRAPFAGGLPDRFRRTLGVKRIIELLREIPPGAAAIGKISLMRKPVGKGMIEPLFHNRLHDVAEFAKNSDSCCRFGRKILHLPLQAQFLYPHFNAA